MEQREENQIVDNEVDSFKKLTLSSAGFISIQNELLMTANIHSSNETFCVLKTFGLSQHLFYSIKDIDSVLSMGVEFVDFCVLTNSETKKHPKYNPKYYEQANKELERFGYIKGYELLSLSTMKKFWVSHYDLVYFEDI